MPEMPGDAGKWLLLVHQLPARPSNLRVHIWRRLQQVGAISLRNSIYVLPNTRETREDFDWIRTEIAGRGGEVNVFSAHVIDGHTDEDLRRLFIAAREGDYKSLLRRAKALRAPALRTQTGQHRIRLRRDLGKLREQFDAVNAIDFFAGPSATAVQQAIRDLEQALVEAPLREVAGHVDRKEYQGRTWLTRPRPGIDRMASAWLIRKFVAPDARFAFGALPAAQGQVPFDMADVDFGHHGTNCTFETLLDRFDIRDLGAKRVGQVVHDLDLKESRYGLPETATIGRLVQGLRESASDDAALLGDGMRMIEALYQSFSRESNTAPRPRRSPAARRSGRRAR